MSLEPNVRTAKATISVRLFARYAELFGTDSLEVPAEGIDTVANLVERLRARPGGGSLGPSTLVAVNLRHARPDTPVSSDDEVALLPPLAGG